MNVYRLKRKKIPPHTVKCLEELLNHGSSGKLTGIAFVAYVEGGYIADACGDARDKPDQTRFMLKRLDAKLAKIR